MLKWIKHGRIFNPTDIKNISWISEFSQCPSVLIFDKYIRVYFTSRKAPDQNGNYISRMGYIDLNRFNLFEILNISEEPVLELGKLGTFDEYGTYPVSVIRNENDIRTYYSGITRNESTSLSVAIGVAISSDNGDTFKKIGEGPILSYSLDEPFILGSPKIRYFENQWCLWYVAGSKWVNHEGKIEPIYKIRVAFSKDGFEWEKLGKNIIEDNSNENECQASPDVFFYNSNYHMFFSFRNHIGYKSNEKKNGYKIGYAISKDLVNFQRCDELVGIEVSKKGWDSDSISYPYLFELDGRILMLYQGNQMGEFGFGLAELAGNM